MATWVHPHGASAIPHAFTTPLPDENSNPVQGEKLQFERHVSVPLVPLPTITMPPSQKQLQEKLGDKAKAMWERREGCIQRLGEHHTLVPGGGVAEPPAPASVASVA